MNKVRTSSQRSGATRRNTTQRSEPKRDKAKRGLGHKLRAQIHSADPMAHDEDHFEQDAPRMSLSKIFIVILLLHVLVIAGLAIMHHGNQPKVAAETETPTEPTGNSANAVVATPDNEELINAANAQSRSTLPVAPPNRAQVKPLPQGWESTLVKSGENIDAVARRVGVERKWLVKANADLNRLAASNPSVRVGQPLAIPPTDVIEEYTVQERLLAQRSGMVTNAPTPDFDTSVETPVVLGPTVVAPPDIDTSTLVEVEPEPVTEEVLEPIPFTDSQPDQSGRQHKVAKGETFYGIGRKYGVSAQALMSHNGYSNAGALGIGDVLRIP